MSASGRQSPDGPARWFRSFFSRRPVCIFSGLFCDTLYLIRRAQVLDLMSWKRVQYFVLLSIVYSVFHIPRPTPVCQLMGDEHVDKDITVSRELAELEPYYGLKGNPRGLFI